MATVSDYSVARLKSTTLLYNCVTSLTNKRFVHRDFFLQKSKRRETPYQLSPDIGINVYLEKSMTIDAEMTNLLIKN